MRIGPRPFRPRQTHGARPERKNEAHAKPAACWTRLAVNGATVHQRLAGSGHESLDEAGRNFKTRQ